MGAIVVRVDVGKGAWEMVLRVPGPFDYYPDKYPGVTGDTIRSEAAAPGSHAAAIASLADELDGDDKRVAGQIEGDAEAGTRVNPQVAGAAARDLAAKGSYAVALLVRFADDVDDFDRSVNRLNVEVAASVAALPIAGLATLAIPTLLRHQYLRAEGELDSAADEIVRMFRTGATPDNVRSLIRSGEMPLAAAGLYPDLHLTTDDKVAHYASLSAIARGELTDAAMSNPDLATLIHSVAGFTPVPGQDFYTTGEHSIQSMLGFHDVYDAAGPALGMDLNDQTFEFTDKSTGVDYRLELWKGSYGYGSAFGGEVGLYTRGSHTDGLSNLPRSLLEHVPGYYSTAQGEQQIQVTQTISNKYTGEQYFTNDGEGADKNPDGTSDQRHFWNLAIRTDPGLTKDDLVQTGAITVQDPGVRAAMLQQMQAQQGESHLSNVYEENGVIHYTWDQ